MRQVLQTGVKLRQRQDARDLLVALTMTGGRWNEVAGLIGQQAEADYSVIRLPGNKTQQGRLVPVAAMLREVLERRSAERGDGPFVFPGGDGGQRDEGSCKPILRAMDACGLDVPEIVARHGAATVRSLRHANAAWLIQRGAGLADVQAVLGHSAVSTTRRYAHMSRGESVRRLGVDSGRRDWAKQSGIDVRLRSTFGQT